MVGVVLVPSAIVTSTPLDCTFCGENTGYCGMYNTTLTYKEDDPKFNAWWVKKYCTYNGSVNWLLLYFPYCVLLIALILFAIEKVFQRSFKAGEKLNKFYHLLNKQMILKPNREEIEIVDSTFDAMELKYNLGKCKSYYYSYLWRTLLEMVVALALLVYMLAFGHNMLTDDKVNICNVHGYYFECHGIPISFYIGALYVTAALTILYMFCSTYNLVWLVMDSFGLSTRLMRSYIAVKEAKGGGAQGISQIYNNNRDLRLLLGLLANRSGLPTVISVLACLDQARSQYEAKSF